MVNKARSLKYRLHIYKIQKDGEVSIGVTYMTGTLVKLGQHVALALLGGNRFGWLLYLLLWCGLVLGATAGAPLARPNRFALARRPDRRRTRGPCRIQEICTLGLPLHVQGLGACEIYVQN